MRQSQIVRCENEYQKLWFAWIEYLNNSLYDRFEIMKNHFEQFRFSYVTCRKKNIHKSLLLYIDIVFYAI